MLKAINKMIANKFLKLLNGNLISFIQIFIYASLRISLRNLNTIYRF